MDNIRNGINALENFRLLIQEKKLECNRTPSHRRKSPEYVEKRNELNQLTDVYNAVVDMTLPSMAGYYLSNPAEFVVLIETRIKHE